MHVARRPLLPAEDMAAQFTLAVIKFRLIRLPLASRMTEAELACAAFFVKMESEMEALWAALPPGERFRVQPFIGCTETLCAELGRTPNPDLVLDQFLDQLQECLVLTYEFLHNSAPCPACAA